MNFKIAAKVTRPFAGIMVEKRQKARSSNQQLHHLWHFP
jgi:hypothetical protein